MKVLTWYKTNTDVKYIHTDIERNYDSPNLIVPIVMRNLNPESVVDVGCGVGTWLKVFQDNGISDILGVDGEYVDVEQLQIDKAKFIAADLSKRITIDRRFHLVVSLEVAEHIPEQSADVFVENLVSLGDNILFSAAIKGQGGFNHVNEQYIPYWIEKFKRYGYQFYDIFRPSIWWNESVDWWYRQNLFLVSKQVSNVLPATNDIICGHHPSWYRGKERLLINLETGSCGIKFAAGVLKRAFFYKLKSLF